MKKIEQAAKEYAEYVSLHSVWTARNAETSFTAGVEFAQQWISVEDELPEDGQEIICKNDTYKSIHIFYKNGVFDEERLKTYYTHWRPENLK